MAFDPSRCDEKSSSLLSYDSLSIIDKCHINSSSSSSSSSSQSMMRIKFQGKRTIACDCDEVLAYFVPALVRFHNHTYGTELTARDFHSYRFCDVWGGTEDETMAKMEEFFSTSYFKNIEAIQDAYETLRRLSRRFRFVVVTSRQHYLKDQTYEWIERFFPGIFSDILLGNHWTRSEDKSKKITKLEMCKKIGACALIDDSTKYARQCSSYLEYVLLFGEYAWNQNDGNSFPKNVRRARNWREVEVLLNRFF